MISGHSVQPPPERIDRLVALFRESDLTAVIEEGIALAADFPKAARVHQIVGAAYAKLRRFDEALECYSRALAIDPSDATAHYNMGNALLRKSDTESAIASYTAAIGNDPNYVEAHFNLGNALRKRHDLEGAIASFMRVLRLRPNDAVAHNNLGEVLEAKGDIEGAIAAYARASHANPNYADAVYNLGNALRAKGNFDAAIDAYSRAIKIKPDHTDALVNMGDALYCTGDFNAAFQAFSRAVQIRPDYAGAHNNLGNVLSSKGDIEGAIAAFRRALRIAPGFAEAFANLGNALCDMGDIASAVEAYSRALELKPDYRAARAQRLHLAARLCDWTTFANDLQDLQHWETSAGDTPPFAALTLDDDPSRNRRRSESWARARYKSRQHPRSTDLGRPPKLRVGYFSADFHDHATMHLLIRLLELHDAEAFEIHLYSYGPPKIDDMRRRVLATGCKFRDVRDLSDQAVAALGRAHGLHVAVDLKGYTHGARPGILACRPAPVQIGYLGYPGTTGAEFLDYMIVDEQVVPPDAQRYYTEKAIYLPHCYQVNDNTRAISNRAFSRRQLGLPDGGFVFSCFNNAYKITPTEFDIWMRLLRSVEGSVLWLLETNEQASENLRREAVARGVHNDRLVFAPRMPSADHLARQEHADLFLDTFRINAHTTASDALWGGLPVLTKTGASLASRVAASLLVAMGLPELITETEQDYEAVALGLATHPSRLGLLRERLRRNRLTAPLFNTELFRVHIEAAYVLAYERYLEGKEPDVIRVPAHTTALPGTLRY